MENNELFQYQIQKIHDLQEQYNQEKQSLETLRNLIEKEQEKLVRAKMARNKLRHQYKQEIDSYKKELTYFKRCKIRLGEILDTDYMKELTYIEDAIKKDIENRLRKAQKELDTINEKIEDKMDRYNLMCNSLLMNKWEMDTAQEYDGLIISLKTQHKRLKGEVDKLRTIRERLQSDIKSKQAQIVSLDKQLPKEILKEKFRIQQKERELEKRTQDIKKMRSLVRQDETYQMKKELLDKIGEYVESIKQIHQYSNDKLELIQQLQEAVAILCYRMDCGGTFEEGMNLVNHYRKTTEYKKSKPNIPVFKLAPEVEEAYKDLFGNELDSTIFEDLEQQYKCTELLQYLERLEQELYEDK